MKSHEDWEVNLLMVFKNSTQVLSHKILPKNQRPMKYLLTIGTSQFICHTQLQVDFLNKAFTETGNIPINYETWDDGDDTKYIVTYQIEDVNTPVVRN